MAKAKPLPLMKTKKGLSPASDIPKNTKPTVQSA